MSTCPSTPPSFNLSPASKQQVTELSYNESTQKSLSTLQSPLQHHATTSLDMKQHIGSKLEKEYIKGICCYPAYLTYMQDISCKMLGWMKHN